AAMDPQGIRFATISAKGTLRLWHAPVGKLLWQKPSALAYVPLPAQPLEAGLSTPGPPAALCLSRKAAWFSECPGDPRILPGALIVFSADGKLLASPDKSGAVCVCET